MGKKNLKISDSEQWKQWLAIEAALGHTEFSLVILETGFLAIKSPAGDGSNFRYNGIANLNNVK